jgi:hypothetical protein
LYDQELIKHPKEPDALINGVEELQQVLQQRREIVFSQALSMCITAFITALMRGISQPALLERYLDCGFLLQVESLLSTFGTEIGMLSDHDAAIQFLRRVRFELRPLPFDNAHENVFCESTQKFVPWRDASDATHHPRTESQTLSSAGVRPPGSWQSTSKTIEQTLPFCDTPLLGVRQCKRTVNQSNGLPTLVDMHAHGITPIVRAIQLYVFDSCFICVSTAVESRVFCFDPVPRRTCAMWSDCRKLEASPLVCVLLSTLLRLWLMCSCPAQCTLNCRPGSRKVKPVFLSTRS